MNRDAVCFREGADPAYVLLHGFTGSPLSFASAAALAPNDGCAIWAFALPGHHPAVPVVSGFLANVRKLADRIEGAAGSATHLIGYSLGARCALAIAAERPERVARATLVGVHPGLEGAEEREARAAADSRWAALLRAEGTDAFVREWERLDLWQTQTALPSSTLAGQRNIRLGHEPEPLAASLKELGLAAMPDLRPSLAETQIPIVLVTGALDTKFTRIGATLGLPHRIVDRVGHNVVLEEPSAIW